LQAYKTATALSLHLLLITKTMANMRTLLAFIQLFVLITVCYGKLHECEVPFLPLLAPQLSAQRLSTQT
jgi:hypothetical protein